MPFWKKKKQEEKQEQEPLPGPAMSGGGSGGGAGAAPGGGEAAAAQGAEAEAEAAFMQQPLPSTTAHLGQRPDDAYQEAYEHNRAANPNLSGSILRERLKNAQRRQLDKGWLDRDFSDASIEKRVNAHVEEMKAKLEGKRNPPQLPYRFGPTPPDYDTHVRNNPNAGAHNLGDFGTTQNQQIPSSPPPSYQATIAQQQQQQQEEKGKDLDQNPPRGQRMG